MLALTIIVAATESNGIGIGTEIPWHIHKDLEYFKHVTQHAPDGHINAVIMGRGTWETIPQKYRPLSGRLNVVLSRNPDFHPDGALTYPDLQAAIVGLPSHVYRVFIIGGSSLYEDVLRPSPPQADRILLTRIFRPPYDCDKFMPEFRDGEYGTWQRSAYEELVEWTGLGSDKIPEGVQEQGEIAYEFQMWTKAL